MSEFQAWPSIGKLSDAARNSRGAKINYRPKIKLHGTNAAIRIDTDGTVTAQSRTKDLKPGKDTDNFGFAAWVESQKHTLTPFAYPSTDMILFGEWYGAGVQKNVALAQLTEKHFAVYAVVLDRTYLVDDPESIQADCVGALPCKVLPWFGPEVTVDFSTRQHDDLLVEINNTVESIDKLCPYALAEHGLTGPGEGLVFYPQWVRHEPLVDYALGMFKAKGAAHRTSTGPAVALKPAASADVLAFVDAHLTGARLQQALVEIGTYRGDLSRISDFLRWVLNDLQKETTAELSASGLEWKKVSKAAGNKAAAWYKGI